MEEEQSQVSNLPQAEVDMVLAFWRSFDLYEKRKEWDKTGNEMREYKTASINGRKKLNEMTKAFRARNKEEQMVSMSELLKAYQEEIDQLSKRCRFVETSYLGIYKSMYESLDPVPALEQLMNSASNTSLHSLEIEKLKAEIKQYDEEFQRLKNQEITIRRLEDQLQELREGDESKIVEESEKRLAKVKEHCEIEVADAKELARSLERRLNQAMDGMKAVQQSADRAQAALFEESKKTETRYTHLQTENNQLSEQLQRLTLRNAELEAEVSSLSRFKAENEHAVTHKQQPSMQDAIDLQTLRDQLQATEDTLRAERVKHEGLLRDVQVSLVREKDTVGMLRQEVNNRVSRQDYDRLRQEFITLKRLAFRSSDDDSSSTHTPVANNSSSSSANPENETEAAIDNESVETLLARRLKLLESELANTRNDLSQSRVLTATLQDHLTQSTTLVSTLQQRLSVVESELEHRNAALERYVITDNASSNHGMSMLASNKEEAQLAHLLLGSSSDTATPRKTSTAYAAVGSTPEKTTGGTGVAGGTVVPHQLSQNTQAVMLKALQAQRDKLRDRLQHAETRSLSLQSQLEDAIAARQQLENDNISLYRKLKFLQTLPQPQLHHHRGSEGGGHDIEARYSTLYEQRINPFAEFSAQERQRKMAELTVADRIVLNTAVAVAKHAIGRSILLCYLFAMHALVFFSMYYLAHRQPHAFTHCAPLMDPHQQQLHN